MRALPVLLLVSMTAMTSMSPPASARTPDWTLDGDQPGARLGAAVAAAGDVDADGLHDIALASPGRDGVGLVQVHLGRAGGPGDAPDWMSSGDQVGEEWGAAVAPAGDVNGDGFADLLIGAPGRDGGAGRACVVLGSASGLEASPAWCVGGGPAERLGSSVAPAGDVNRDGHDDIVVGAESFDGTGADSGRALLFLGSPSGPSATPQWIAEGDQPSARASVVAPAGDVDGDGHPDVLVGAPGRDGGRGQALLYRGTPAGLEPAPAWSITGSAPGGRLGESLLAAGDLDGDGYADIVIGEPASSRVVVHAGSPTGPSPAPTDVIEDASLGELGASVGFAGDVDGDLHADVVLGAPGFGAGNGRVQVHRGRPFGLAPTAAWTFDGDLAGSRLGASAGLAGDVDGDGLSDVLVGSPDRDGGSGRVDLFRGSAPAIPDREQQVIRPTGFLEVLVSARAAGDVNGDGYSDMVTVSDGGWWPTDVPPARVYLGGPDGLSPTSASEIPGYWSSATSAGDVDGDGHDDVLLVWAQQGRIELHRGTPTGIEAAAAWSHVYPRSHYAVTATGAGDVNCDGYADVVTGDPDHVSRFWGEGILHAFHGSPFGLSPVPDWEYVGSDLDTWLGASLAGVGDVDGDGYSDVLAGAPAEAPAWPPAYGWDSFVVLFSGSADGLSSAPTWERHQSPIGALLVDLGSLAAGAGDVNGDGHADFLVGSYRAERVELHLGSPAGPSPAPDVTLDDCNARGIAAAGDVDGDGLDDVLVAARLAGSPASVHLFRGTPGGIETVPTWSTPRTGVFRGSGLGDVDGDGRADFAIAGFRSSIDSLVDVHHGGDGSLASPIDQWRADGTGPLPLQAATTPADGFRMRLDARGPFGRDILRLERQVRRVPTTFAGPAIASEWTDTGAPGAEGSRIVIDQLHAPLPAGRHAWRARLRSSFPLPWHSTWRTDPGSGEREGKVFVADCGRPVAQAGTPVPVDCRNVRLENALASDPLGSPMTLSFTADRPDVTIEPAVVVLAPDDVLVDPAPIVTLAAGASACNATATVTLEAISDDGRSATSSVGVAFRDETPPVVADPEAVVGCAWPPNGKLVRLATADLAVSFDECSGIAAWHIVDCVSDDSSAHPAPECTIEAGGGAVMVRAARAGADADGRRYVLMIVAADSCGNESAPQAGGAILVPHDQSAHPRCTSP